MTFNSHKSPDLFKSTGRVKPLKINPKATYIVLENQPLVDGFQFY